jgi:hypothetical protein
MGQTPVPGALGSRLDTQVVGGISSTSIGIWLSKSQYPMSGLVEAHDYSRLVTRDYLFFSRRGPLCANEGSVLEYLINSWPVCGFRTKQYRYQVLLFIKP